MPDPYLGILYLDETSQTLQPLFEQDNSSLFGSEPYIQFRVPFTGTYFIAVTDATGGIGDYTFGFSASGPAPAPFIGGDSVFS
ncbi:MAG: hypothetical protein HC899_20205 [Leptolyngbyaceae cyanobacterium SM1_4_3]|nr:hypothetical protein [Leptolyngbyaceae cyanobacterium SM1_4_3]